MRRDAGIGAQLGMQLPLPHIQARDMRRAMLQQAIGKATGGLANIQTAQARHIQFYRLESTFQLQSATADVTHLGLILQLQFGICRHFVTILAHSLPYTAARAPLHPRSNQTLGLAAGGGKLTVNQELVGAHQARPSSCRGFPRTVAPEAHASSVPSAVQPLPSFRASNCSRPATENTATDGMVHSGNQ